MAEDHDMFPKEKRRSPRVSGAVIEYSIEGQDGNVKKAFIKDICLHGVGIYVPEIIKEETVLVMEIYLFGSDIPINAKGRVVWNKKGEYVGHHNVGIEFSELSEEHRKKLSDHILANLTQ